jgi:hypothetical protein
MVQNIISCDKLMFMMLVLFLSTGVCVAAQLPLATLTLDPPSTLPGLPVAFIVTVTNPDVVPVTIVDSMTLRVTTAAEAFLAQGVAGRTNLNISTQNLLPCGSGHCLTIPGHGERQIYVNYGPVLGLNEFFADSRLSSPGAYSLQIILYENTGAAPFPQVITNAATLTVTNPAGVDAEVWQFLKDTSTSHVWTLYDWTSARPALANHIRAFWPASTYAMWVAALGSETSHAEMLANINAALARNPPASLRDNLLLSKGALLAGWSDETLYNQRNLDQALNLADQARVVLQLLQQVTTVDLMRTMASDQLSHILTTATARKALEDLAAGDAPAPKKVVPYVDCVSPLDGHAFTARFGYSNPNSARKILQISELNQLTPAPRDLGPASLF